MALKNQERYPVISIVIAVTILMTIALPRLEAQSPASAPMPEVDPCMTALFNMSDCLSYVTSGSNETKPDKACCPELAGLVDSNPICLCQLLGQPDKLGISIDLNKALQLPSVCKVDTPPVSTCAAIGIPVAAPTTTPTSSSPGDAIGNPPLSSPTAIGIPVAAPTTTPTSSSPGDAIGNPPLSSPTGDIAPGEAAASPPSTGANSASLGSSLAITSLQWFVGLAIMLFSNLF